MNCCARAAVSTQSSSICPIPAIRTSTGSIRGGSMKSCGWCWQATAQWRCSRPRPITRAALFSASARPWRPPASPMSSNITRMSPVSANGAGPSRCPSVRPPAPASAPCPGYRSMTAGPQGRSCWGHSPFQRIFGPGWTRFDINRIGTAAIYRYYQKDWEFEQGLHPPQ